MSVFFSLVFYYCESFLAREATISCGPSSRARVHSCPETIGQLPPHPNFAAAPAAARELAMQLMVGVVGLGRGETAR